MAIQSAPIWDESFICTTSNSLASSQFFFVNSTGTLTSGLPTINLCTGTSFGAAAAVGVLQDTPAAGRAGVVRVIGVSKVVATTSASVTYGSPITCSTGGFAMVADTTGQTVYGRCVAASTTLVLGALCEVMLTGPYVYVLS